MRRPAATLARAVPLALVLTLLVSTAAVAHPFFREGEAPVDSLASLTLDLVHGCEPGGDDHGDDGGHSHGDDGLGDPTTDVSLEVPDQVRIVEVAEVEGWDVELERSDTGRVEVVTWTATTAQEPAPRFPLEVVIDGAPGSQLYFRVFQACDDFIYRWVGTPDEPADDPAVRLELTDADPDRPAPPPETPDEAVAPEAPADEAATEDPATDAEDPATDDGVADEELDVAPISAPTEPETSPLLWVVVGLVGAGLLLALVLALRRRPAAASAPVNVGDEPADDATAQLPPADGPETPPADRPVAPPDDGGEAPR